jgi:hypothetical protein
LAASDLHVTFPANREFVANLPPSPRHVPGTTWQDGVRFEEVSFGYPEETERDPERPRTLRQILPAPVGKDP